MSNPSKDKGTRGEMVARDLLRKYTTLKWERTPLSGALDPKHGLKSDLYVPNEHNLYAIEVKSYEDDHLTSQILTSKTPQLIQWWEQAVRQGKQVDKKPLLIFKHNRSKMFVAFEDIPSTEYRKMFVEVIEHSFYVAVLEDWLLYEQPKFIK